jgi:hypothetical protein
MKIISKYFSYFGLALALCAMIFSGCSCSTTKTDPLAGWQKDYGTLDQPIVNDYQNYIQNLSSKEKKHMGPTDFFKDGTGQYAVTIIVGINGRYWRHILIYDKDDKRIKTIKYKTGYYQS